MLLPPISVCVLLSPPSNPTPTTHTPSRETCRPIVGRVLPLRHEEAVGPDWLPLTVRHSGERHAAISVVPEAFFSTTLQHAFEYNLDLDIGRGLRELRDYGFCFRV